MKNTMAKFRWGSLKVKKVLLAVTVSALVLSLVSIPTIFASTISECSDNSFGTISTKKFTSKDGRVVNVTFMNGTTGKVPDSHINDIIENNKDGENIQILEVGCTKPSSGSNYTTTGITFISPVIKTTFTTEEFESDRFMASCAKGQKLIVSTDITAKLGASADGNVLAKAGLKLNADISYTIRKGTELVGPPESSTCNSREFRCKFYKNTGIWERFGLMNNIPFYFWGDWTEPHSYESYSIDKVIKR